MKSAYINNNELNNMQVQLLICTILQTDFLLLQHMYENNTF